MNTDASDGLTDGSTANASREAVPAWLNQCQTGMLVIGVDGWPVSINAAAGDLLGVTSTDALAPLLDDSALAELVERAGRDQRAVVSQDVAWPDPGSRFSIDVSVTPLDDGQVLVELRDAGSRHRALDDHDRTSRQALSRRVVRQLAHEVRNPLSGLRGAAQLLARDASTSRDRELLEIILAETERLGRLVDDLLGPARPVRRVPGNVHQPLERMRALVSAQAGESCIIERDYDPSLPLLALDEDLVVQALLNLGRNALEADASEIVLRTRSVGRVTLAGTLHRLAIAVEVIDNGRGVPEELHDGLFFPLVTGREDGTGLGLAIAQDIVDRHGGTIDFTSRPGRTVFRLLLPVD